MYIGNNLQVANPSYKIIDDISSGFNGSTTSFALQVSGATPVPFPISTQQVMISVNGVVQEPDPSGSAGFKLLGSNIVFSSAPANGHAFFGTILAGADYVTAGAEFPDGSVTAPSFTFEADQDSGWYRIGSGSVGYSANGVQTLNFDGNGLTIASGKGLTVDTNTLHVDATNNRVGIGTTSPASIFHCRPLDETNFLVRNEGSNVVLASETNNGRDNNRGLDFEATYFTFIEGGTERMRIDSSGRLLIGTTTEGHVSADNLTIAGSGDVGITIRSGTSSEGSIMFSDGTSGDDEYRGWINYNQNSNFLRFFTNTAERMRINSDGHMGIGVTPSAWTTNGDSRGLQIGTGFAAFGRGSGDEDRGGISVNYYNDGSDKYIGNGNANRVYMADGNITFEYAATNSSGAGAALTRVEYMKLDTAGRLLLGTTTEGHADADNFTVEGSGNAGITIRSGTSNEGNIFFADSTSGDAEYRGMLRYDHNTDSCYIKTAATTALTLDSSQNATFAGALTTNGSVSITSGELNFNTAGHKYIDFATEGGGQNYDATLRTMDSSHTNHETSLVLTRNGGVKAYFDNAIKFQTTTAGVTVTGTVTDSKGDLRKIIFQASASSAYTLVSGDAGKAVATNGQNITVPNDVFASGGGDAVTIVNNSASDVTITRAITNLYLGSDGANSASLTMKARTTATIFFSSPNHGYISGGGLS